MEQVNASSRDGSPCLVPHVVVFTYIEKVRGR
jgi:hypothetical protein